MTDLSTLSNAELQAAYAAHPDVAPATTFAPAQQAYAKANAPYVPGSAAGTAQQPYYDAPGRTGDDTTYHVTPQGGLSAPAGASGGDLSGLSDAALRSQYLASAATLPPITKSDEMLGFTHELERPIQNLSHWANNGLAAAGVPMDAINRTLGFPTQAEQDANFQRPVDQAAAQGVKPGLIGGAAGALIGTLPTLALPGGALAQGAVAGALTTDKPDDPMAVAGGAALGGVGGKVGEGIVQGIGKAIAPTVRPEAAELMRMGVKLTPGRIAGGGAQRLEDGFTSIPLMGDMVGNRIADSVDDLNRVAVNRALAPIGKTLPDDVKTGFDAIDHAHDALSKGYQELLPKLTPKLDQQFWKDATNTVASAQNDLTPERGAQLKNILQSRLVPRVQQGGRMSGETFKDIDTQLGQLARKYVRSPDADIQSMGQAIGDVQGHLRASLTRANPQFADDLGNLNEGWANLKRVESAAAMAGNKGGVFSAPGLDNAVKRMAGPGEFARGNALMQDLSRPAREVLPSTVPDSGSPYRHALEAFVALGVGKESKLANIPTMLMAGLPAAAYSKGGQKIVTPLLTDRPAWAGGARQVVDRFAPYTALPAGLIGGSAPRLLAGPGGS